MHQKALLIPLFHEITLNFLLDMFLFFSPVFQFFYVQLSFNKTEWGVSPLNAAWLWSWKVPSPCKSRGRGNIKGNMSTAKIRD